MALRTILITAYGITGILLRVQHATFKRRMCIWELRASAASVLYIESAHPDPSGGTKNEQPP